MRKNVTLKTFNPGELEPMYKRTILVKTMIENDVYPYKIAQSNANYLNYTNLNHKVSCSKKKAPYVSKTWCH